MDEALSDGRSWPGTGGALAASVTRAFDDLPDWETVDPRPALAALGRMCEPGRRPSRRDAPWLAALCPALAELPADPAAARAMVERIFRPVPVSMDGTGFLTGYFEPELEASSVRTAIHRHPLLAPPPDLVRLDGDARPDGFPEDLTGGRLLPDGRIVPHPDRGAIAAGALAGRGLEIAWLADSVDLFFVHIQGSARLRMEDGTVRRVGYAGKSGHPYTPIGRVLVEMGAMERDAVTADAIAGWLRANPDAATAVMNRNRSYIFFRDKGGEGDGALGPTAAAGVPLTPRASVATDTRHLPFGTLLFLAGDLPVATADAEAPFRTIAVAQDVGSAIVGPARADLFWGSGRAAGRVAGRIRHRVRMVALVPRHVEGDPAAPGGDGAR